MQISEVYEEKLATDASNTYVFELVSSGFSGESAKFLKESLFKW